MDTGRSRFLLKELILFFIPSAVAVIRYRDTLTQYGIDLILIIMISSLRYLSYRTFNRIATKAERINAMIGFLCLLLTLFTYWISKMYQRWNWSLLSPLLVCPIILIALLLGLDTPYETYESGGHWLTELLKPATVAFAWPIYKYFDLLKKHGMAILLNVIVGSFYQSLLQHY